MHFTKMHGLGNDYLYLDGFSDPTIPRRTDLHDLTRMICDRHRGVGADGLIVLSRPHDSRSHVRMRMFNADGIDGGVCGNGTRCAAKFVVDRGYASADRPMVIDSGPRMLTATVQRDERGRVVGATVSVGKCVFDLDRVPVDRSQVREVEPDEPAHPGLFKVDHRTACFASVGNPHMIAFIEEPVDLVNLGDEGPKFERHPAFPQRINYHVVNVLSRGSVRMRTWERGSGITQACASGACAVAGAGIALGHLDHQVDVRMPGGSLAVRLDAGTGELLMTGEAVEVFSGEWNA